ncbi:MAG: hypothetical protein CVU05_01255 [Bacteroidetes bacterium HGW-Bacteroidetes-21]|nr:MAG: hypothetical protein CVU05_01255 [Bacteroidetes bacterium HGW-Bacteroidetes-21]
MTKRLIITGFLICTAFYAGAQFIVRSESRVETMPFTLNSDVKQPALFYRAEFEQKIFWRTMFNEKDQEKTVYHFHSVYKLDSIIGAVIYGIDIDMLGAAFKKQGPNRFRYWNKLRLGMALLAEANPEWDPIPAEKFYDYLNAMVYISFLHLPSKARGDQTTKARRGSYMLYAMMTPSQRQEFFLKFKPVGSTWVKFNYFKEFNEVWAGAGVEVEVNPNGYDNSVTHSSKDVYRGLTIMAGTWMNTSSQELSLRVGLKWNMCNH